MTQQEFNRLMAYHNAAQLQREHMPIWKHSKRSVNGGGKGVGQVLAHSYIKPQVSMERIFK